MIQILPEPAVFVSVRNPVLPALEQSHHCLIQCRTLDKKYSGILYAFNSPGKCDQFCGIKMSEIIKNKANNLNIKLTPTRRLKSLLP